MKPTPLTDQIALDTRVEFGSIEKLLASHRSLERDRAELIEALQECIEMFSADDTQGTIRDARALLSRLGADK